ncbi:MAG: hypothetical protein GY862_26900 [Gammaproteobacteria bacterium]|nr:hypothetical protein [Gammaproteobacteria bacterium]MCP5013822.1 hypothetical protein [Ketobacter sp.]
MSNKADQALRGIRFILKASGLTMATSGYDGLQFWNSRGDAELEFNGAEYFSSDDLLQLDAETPIVEADAIAGILQEISRTIKGGGYSDRDRGTFIRLLTDGICTYCGKVDDNCYCVNDE